MLNVTMRIATTGLLSSSSTYSTTTTTTTTVSSIATTTSVSLLCKDGENEKMSKKNILKKDKED